MAARTPEIDLRDSLVGNNYIINGDMSISQRGTTFSSIAAYTYSLDRYIYIKSGTTVHTITQDSDVPTFAQAGYTFKNSLRLNLTTPDTSIAAGDFAGICQRIEGNNFSKLAQKPFTLSFWVKATTPGIYCVRFDNINGDRTYVAEYIINSSNTWEYKTMTISASPSTGSWNYTTGIGLEVSWILASGTAYQTTAGTWQTGNYLATSNQVNGVNTGATDFRITGVMLNEGTEALPFSLAGGSYGSELVLCQRYYQRVGELRSSVYSAPLGSFGGYVEKCPFVVSMRISPTFQVYPDQGSFLNPGNVKKNGSTNSNGIAVRRSTLVEGYFWNDGCLTSAGDYWSFHWIADAEL